MQQQVILSGITKDDIAEIFQRAIADLKNIRPQIMFLDASYLYSFDISDYDLIRKIGILTRYDIRNVIEWHRNLERWLNDQTVVLNGRDIKPLKIVRSFDKVPNEALEMIAMCLIGKGGSIFKYHAVGQGIGLALPSDTTLIDEIDRINVTTSPGGGSLSRDGSTLYIIGNHEPTVPTPDDGDITETGVFDSANLAVDTMLDHTMFDVAIPHTVNVDAPGSSTIIYQCSS